LISFTIAYSTKVEKQEMVLKPYFLSHTLVAIFSTETKNTLLPSWFSSILCFVNYRIHVDKWHILNLKQC